MTAPSTASVRPVFSDIGKALGTDYFLLKADLTNSEQQYLERTRQFVQDEVMPVINGYWERAEVPVDLCRRLGEAAGGMAAPWREWRSRRRARRAGRAA